MFGEVFICQFLFTSGTGSKIRPALVLFDLQQDERHRFGSRSRDMGMKIQSKLDHRRSVASLGSGDRECGRPFVMTELMRVSLKAHPLSSMPSIRCSERLRASR